MKKISVMQYKALAFLLPITMFFGVGISNISIHSKESFWLSLIIGIIVGSLIVGCFISNLFSEIMLYDIIFGTFATVISCIVINNTKNIYIAGIAPVVFNGLIVGAELSIAFQTPYFLNVFWVSLGEFVVMIIGVLAFLKLKNNTVFMELIKANRNIKDD